MANFVRPFEKIGLPKESLPKLMTLIDSTLIKFDHLNLIEDNMIDDLSNIMWIVAKKG